MELILHIFVKMEVFLLEENDNSLMLSQEVQDNSVFMENEGKVGKCNDVKTSGSLGSMHYSDISDDDDFVFPLSKKYGIDTARYVSYLKYCE